MTTHPLSDRRVAKKFRTLVDQSLGDSELQSLCYNLGLDYENISGNTKKEKILSLLIYLGRRQQYEDLIMELADMRSDLDLQQFGGPAPTPVEKPSTPVRATSVASRTESIAAESRPRPATTEYVNFDILVTKNAGSNYTIRASHHYQGGAGDSERQELDLQDAEFKNLFMFLEELVAARDDAKTFGAKLYDFLFPPNVDRVFTALRSTARNVRVRLQVEPPELSRLPWEYMYDARQNTFLAKDLQTPIVRYIEQSYTPESLQSITPLRILMALADPSDVPGLEIDKEEELLKQALAPLGSRVELQVLRQVTGYRLHNALARFKPHVLHFVGHGEFANGEGALLIENDERKARRLVADQLADAVRNRGVKLVVLNACNTAKSSNDELDAVSADTRGQAFMAVAPALVYARIPAVIAMQFKVPDRIALRYTQALYDQLAMGTPLDRAITEMRIAASLGDSPEDQVLWAIPSLFMRARDGRLWDADSLANVPTSASISDSSAAPSSAAVTESPPAAAGPSISVGGNLTTGDITFGNKVGGDSISAGRDVNIVNNIGSSDESESGSNDALISFIGQIGDAIVPLKTQLNADDAKDMVSNLDDAQQAIQTTPPRVKRAIRKLNNVLEVLEDANIGDNVIDMIDQAVRMVKKLES